jgi:hypothetical protein
MKKSTLAMAFVLAAFLVIGLNSCKDEPVASDDNPYEMAIWMAPEPDNSPAVITEESLEQPFDLVQEELDYRYCDNTSLYGKPDFKNKRQFLPLARILKSLDLTDAQKEQIKGFLFDFRLCMKDAIKDLRQSEREVLQPFNEQRKAVVDAYKGGTISREDAMAQLKEIKTKVKEALKVNNFRNIACEAMKLCRKTLLDSIGKILEGEQITKWNEWLAKLPDKPCTETVNQ